ncbi:MAG: LysR family transcriptional regulator [Bryobacterales bacterium]|jgi:DNA-binding transcriptional LysR family regulator|nr:LysR family transcriptional regulator [Bryobacterales bacterium]
MAVRVDSDHLRLFRDIVLQRSISKGAALHGISQSAASQHLQDLERRLGETLLDRSTRPFRVTEFGTLYLELCQDLLARCETFDRDWDRNRNLITGTLRVAAIYSVGLSTMTAVESAFRARFPAATLELEYLRPDRVYESILQESCELGLISYPESNRDIAVMPWLDEQMVLGVSPGHPLAARRQVQPAELNGVSFIAFDPDLPIRRHIDGFLAEWRILVKQTMAFDNIQMIKEALVLGRGVSILPLRMMDAEIHEGKLVAIPIEAEGLVRPLGVIHLRRRPFSPVAERFCAMLQEDFVTAGETISNASHAV